jgi:hypothetical protein
MYGDVCREKGREVKDLWTRGGVVGIAVGRAVGHDEDAVRRRRRFNVKPITVTQNQSCQVEVTC